MSKINKTQLKAMDKGGEYIDIHPITYAENVFDRSGKPMQDSIDALSNSLDTDYYNKKEVDEKIVQMSPSISFNKQQKKFTLTRKMTQSISTLNGHKLLAVIVTRNLEYMAIFIKNNSPTFKLNVYEKSKELMYITTTAKINAVLKMYDADGGYWYQYGDIYNDKLNMPLYNTRSICYTTQHAYYDGKITAYKMDDIKETHTVPFILTCTNTLGMLKYKGKRGEVLYNTEKKCLCVMHEFNQFVELGNSVITNELESKYGDYIKNLDKSIKDRLSKL